MSESNDRKRLPLTVVGGCNSNIISQFESEALRILSVKADSIEVFVRGCTDQLRAVRT